MAGGRHCGNLTLVFETALEPSAVRPRACQCRFCVRHGARYVADPNSAVHYDVQNDNQLVRYRFGLETADFSICGRCGVFVGAMLTDGANRWAAPPVDVLEDRARFTYPAEPLSWDGEGKGERIDRRKTRWTPATLGVGTDRR
jgi:hypothetical protein